MTNTAGALVTHGSFLSVALQISTQKSIDSSVREDVLNPQTGQLELALSRQCGPAVKPRQGSRPKSSHGVWLMCEEPDRTVTVTMLCTKED